MTSNVMFKKCVNYLFIICGIIMMTACSSSSEDERSLKLISDVKKNGNYDMSNFCFYCLLNDGMDDIEDEFDDKNRCIKETNPFISYAEITYNEEKTNCVSVKVYDSSEYTGSVIEECDFEFGDKLHAKAEWKKNDIEEGETTKGYYMFEFDSEGRKTYIAEYIGESLNRYKEYYYEDTQSKSYTYDAKGVMQEYSIAQKGDLLELTQKYLADNTQISSDEKEYYTNGIIKRHTRVNGDENETFLYNEDGVQIKTESYYDNGNLSISQEYDNNGYLINVSKYAVNGDKEYITTYENDEHGMPVYVKNGSFEEDTITETRYNNEYELNEQGKPLVIKVYSEDGKLVETYEYTYDADGNVEGSVYSKAEGK